MTGKDVAMPAADFLAWLKAMNLNDSKAAQALGLGSRNTLVKYKIEGAPRYIALACAALAAGGRSDLRPEEVATVLADLSRPDWQTLIPELKAGGPPMAEAAAALEVANTDRARAGVVIRALLGSTLIGK